MLLSDQDFQNMISLSNGPTVTMSDMLEARENRVATQRKWLQLHPVPLVSLTLVLPGVFKNSNAAQFIFMQAIHELQKCVQTNEWVVLAHEIEGDLICGPQAFFCIDHEPKMVKQTLLTLEDNHVLGRLWDFDVIKQDFTGVSRKDLGVKARQCFICEEAAHACARSQSHELHELHAHIETVLRQCFARKQ